MKFPAGIYTPQQLDILKSAFDITCAELHIGNDDAHGRDQVARALLDFSKAGEFEIEKLKAYAISRYVP